MAYVNWKLQSDPWGWNILLGVHALSILFSGCSNLALPSLSTIPQNKGFLLIASAKILWEGIDWPDLGHSPSNYWVMGHFSWPLWELETTSAVEDEESKTEIKSQLNHKKGGCGWQEKRGMQMKGRLKTVMHQCTSLSRLLIEFNVKIYTWIQNEIV